MRKVITLLRLDGLYAATIRCEHDAGACIIIDDGEPLAIAAQVTVLVDKIAFCHLHILCNGADVRLRQANIPSPSTAGAAALAMMDEATWHVLSLS